MGSLDPPTGYLSLGMAPGTGVRGGQAAVARLFAGLRIVREADAIVVIVLPFLPYLPPQYVLEMIMMTLPLLASAFASSLMLSE